MAKPWRSSWMVFVLMACGTENDMVSPSTERPLVRFGGGETTDFGAECDPSLAGDPEEQSAVLQRLRANPDAIVAQLETDWKAPLRWEDCAEEGAVCSEDVLTLTLWVDSLEIPSGVEAITRAEVVCGRQPWLRALVQLSTASGRLAGAYRADLNPTFEGDWQITAGPDLRNFEGGAPLSIDGARPHWAQLATILSLGNEVGGSFEGLATYTDGEQVSSSQAMPLALWGTYIDRVGFTESGGWSPGPDGFTLDDYDGSATVPTFPVEVMVSAEDAEQGDASVDLRVTVNGEDTLYENLVGLQLVQLGDLPRGARVMAEAINVHGAAKVSVQVRFRATCTPARVECAEAGCTARTETEIEPLFCIQA